MNRERLFTFAISVALCWRPFSYFAIEAPFVVPRYGMALDVPGEIELALLLPPLLATVVLGATVKLRTGTLIALSMGLCNVLFVYVMTEFRMRHFEHSESDVMMSLFSFLTYSAVSGLLMVVGHGLGVLWRRMCLGLRRSGS